MGTPTRDISWRSILSQLQERRGSYSLRIYRVALLILTRKIRWLAAIALLLYTGLLGWLGLARNEDILPHLPEILKYDKALHFVAFSVFSMILYTIWIDESIYAKAVVTGGLMLILSVLSEAIQSLSPHRRFDAADIVPNVLGSGLGVIISAGTDTLNRFIRGRYNQPHQVRQASDAHLDGEDDILLDEMV